MANVIEALRERFKPFTYWEIDGKFYQVIEEPEPFLVEVSYGPLSPGEESDEIALDNLKTPDDLTMRVFVIGIDNKYVKVKVKTEGVDRLRVRGATTLLDYETSPAGDEALIPFYVRGSLTQSLFVRNTSDTYTVSGTLKIKGVTVRLARVATRPTLYGKITISPTVREGGG